MPMKPENYIRLSPSYSGAFSSKEEEYLCNLRDRDYLKGFPLSPGYERVLAHRIAKKIPKLQETLKLLYLAEENAPPKLKQALDEMFREFTRIYPQTT